MAKKKAPARRTAPSGRKATRKRAKKTDRYRNVILALGILLTVVLAAAIVVRVFLPPVPASRPAPPPPADRKPVAGTFRPPAAPVTTPPVATTRVPTYEIFPPREGPPRPIVGPGRPAGTRPQVALVIDDIGYDRALAEAFFSLDVPLTLSILPFSPHGKAIAAAARRRGQQVMLHLPMEPEEFPRIDPGPGALLVAMTPDQLIGQLRRDLEEVPGAVGVNNHMGSRLTQDSDRLNQIFSVLKQRGLFFVDSRTTEKTLGHQSARLLRVPFAQRDVFIDHVQEPAFIRRQLDKLVRSAEANGQVVGIGHPHPATIEALREWLPAIRQRVDLVPVAAIVHTLS